MTGMGQIERLPRPGLGACHVIRQQTLAGAHGNRRDAPIPAIAASIGQQQRNPRQARGYKAGPARRTF
jgi:hypothetical protein